MAWLVSKDFQLFPETGKLAANKNLSLTCLVNKLSSHDDALLYSYVVDTIELHGSDFVQTGSGPNFQGDLITLCTCKHRMRTGRGTDEWCGVWIAGLSSIRKTKVNGLVYLMKVSQTFESQYELWKWLRPEVRQAKSACLHRLGDVFEPNADCILLDGQFDPKSYKPPRTDHTHGGIDPKSGKPHWYKDVDYQGYGSRRPALLVGDPEMSFLWPEPIIRYKCPPHPRTKKWESLQKLLKQLKEQEKEH